MQQPDQATLDQSGAISADQSRFLLVDQTEALLANQTVVTAPNQTVVVSTDQAVVVSTGQSTAMPPNPGNTGIEDYIEPQSTSTEAQKLSNAQPVLEKKSLKLKLFKKIGNRANKITSNILKACLSESKVKLDYNSPRDENTTDTTSFIPQNIEFDENINNALISPSKTLEKPRMGISSSEIVVSAVGEVGTFTPQRSLNATHREKLEDDPVPTRDGNSRQQLAGFGGNRAPSPSTSASRSSGQRKSFFTRSSLPRRSPAAVSQRRPDVELSRTSSQLPNSVQASSISRSSQKSALTSQPPPSSRQAANTFPSPVIQLNSQDFKLIEAGVTFSKKAPGLEKKLKEFFETSDPKLDWNVTIIAKEIENYRSNFENQVNEIKDPKSTLYKSRQDIEKFFNDTQNSLRRIQIRKIDFKAGKLASYEVFLNSFLFMFFLSRYC